MTRRTFFGFLLAGLLAFTVSPARAAIAVTLRGRAPFRALPVSPDWIAISVTIRNRQRRAVELNGVVVPGNSSRFVPVLKLAKQAGQSGIFLLQHGGGPYHLQLLIEDAPPASAS